MKTKQSKICMATGNIYKTIIQFSDYIISFGFKNIYTIAHTFSVVSVLIKMESTEHRLRNAKKNRITQMFRVWRKTEAMRQTRGVSVKRNAKITGKSEDK